MIPLFQVPSQDTFGNSQIRREDRSDRLSVSPAGSDSRDAAAYTSAAALSRPHPNQSVRGCGKHPVTAGGKSVEVLVRFRHSEAKRHGHATTFPLVGKVEPEGGVVAPTRVGPEPIWDRYSRTSGSVEFVQVLARARARRSASDPRPDQLLQPGNCLPIPTGRLVDVC